ncbi:MAG TPA: hypothetical protein VGD80_32020 [Kofleriaceae bacterium]
MRVLAPGLHRHAGMKKIIKSNQINPLRLAVETVRILKDDLLDRALGGTDFSITCVRHSTAHAYSCNGSCQC